MAILSASRHPPAVVFSAAARRAADRSGENMLEKSKGAALSRRTFLGAGGALALAGFPGAALAAARDRVLPYRDDLQALLEQLVRIRSLSGEDAAAAQAVVTDWLTRLPYRIEESADRPSHYGDHAEFMAPNPPGDGPFINVVGRPEGSRACPVGLFSHIDTHLLVDGWDTEPLTPVMRGSRMYGLGTADDKGGIAAMLVAAKILAEAGEPLPTVMSLHGKGGGSRGSLPVFERLRGAGETFDGVLYIHPAETGRGLADIKNEVQGVVDLELSVTGWRAEPMEIGSLDSAPWDQGGNALEAAWTALDLLQEGAYAGVLVNAGQMQGGDRAGSVAETARLRFRLKFGGSNTWRELLATGRAQLAAISEALATPHGRFELSLDAVAYRTNPGLAPWDSSQSRVLRNAITEVTGRAPDAYPNHYAGDIRYPIRLLGTQAYGIGSLGGNFYGPNEWVDVDDLLNLVAVTVQTVSGWAALAGSSRR